MAASALVPASLPQPYASATRMVICTMICTCSVLNSSIALRPVGKDSGAPSLASGPTWQLWQTSSSSAAAHSAA